MPAAARTYWLTTSCRIRRNDQSLVIERESGDKIHIPVTDVRDIIACAPADLNTAAISLLNQHHINVHFLSHYGDYAGSLLTAETSASGEIVLGQVRLSENPRTRIEIARSIVVAAAFNIRRVVDRKLLDRPYAVLEASADAATSTSQLMAAEGTFRRSAWEVLDTRLPDWLQLAGRTRRPPANAGNALISYVNGIIYARVLTAIRLTPLHTGIAFRTAQWSGTGTPWSSTSLKCSSPCSPNGCCCACPEGSSSNPATSTQVPTWQCSVTWAASSSCRPCATNSPRR